MSLLYPNTVTFSRPQNKQGSAKGALGYGGRTASSNTSIKTGVPANIQAKRDGQSNPVGLPGDGTYASWRIFIPNGQLAKGQVEDGDIATDEVGRTFQVTSDYFHPLGATFTALRLEP